MIDVKPSLQSVDGCPCILLPGESFWSLVEYLAMRGIQAEYEYVGAGFQARFLHLSEAAATKVLEDWIVFEQRGGRAHAPEELRPWRNDTSDD